MSRLFPKFSSVWFVIAIIRSDAGEKAVPVALAVKEARANVASFRSVSALNSATRAPYPTDATTLIVCIDAVAVASLHLALGWSFPERLVDLMVEYRNFTNVSDVPPSASISTALVTFGLPPFAALAARSGLAASSDGIDATSALFERLVERIDLARAMLRGRYLIAVARMERVGVPLDAGTLRCLRAAWSDIRSKTIRIVKRDYDVFDGEMFDSARFERWLRRIGITWSCDSAGRMMLDDQTFRDMARLYPIVRPLKDLKSTLRDFDPLALTVGSDGRNRTPLRPFHARTGRNQPRSSQSIFGGPAWIRNLIKPSEGNGLALLDWQQQEFGIAAALSGDPAMRAAYAAGDPFLALAIASGAAPIGATKSSHGDVRERFKACALSAQYGVTSAGLARISGLPVTQAHELLCHHRQTFPKFWSWSDRVETTALLSGELQSVFGWRMSVGHEPNLRSLRNFPVQANGAEMLRLACCEATEGGISVCMPVHDALLIEAPIEQLDDAIVQTQDSMAKASSLVLDGFTLRTSVRTVRWPHSWEDERGQVVWQAITQARDADREPAHPRDTTCSP